MLYSENIIQLCKLMNLGALTSIPQKVTGGLLHTMWHIHTATGEYALKELNPIIMSKPSLDKVYELSEKISLQFADKGIPAVTSLQHNGHSVIKINNNFFIVYPWVSNILLQKKDITVHHTQKIGTVLARMHHAKLHIDGVSAAWTTYNNDYYYDILNLGIKGNLVVAQELTFVKNLIERLNQKYQNAIPVLNTNLVISHGDLDPKNVLWHNNGEPHLIDWESARLLNPTQEVINAALDWGGIASGHIHEDNFYSLIRSYQSAGGHVESHLLDEAISAIAVNWLNWVVYNIERSFTTTISDAERQLAAEQVNCIKIVIFITHNAQQLIANIESP